jgi:hypothetical protein
MLFNQAGNFSEAHAMPPFRDWPARCLAGRGGAGFVPFNHAGDFPPGGALSDVCRALKAAGRRILPWFCFSWVLALPLRAEEPISEIIPSTNLIMQASSLPEAKLSLAQSFTFPFLRGESPLTAGNNIRTALSAEVSPISVNGLAEAVWTPVAFFQAAAGGRAGSGWNISLSGSELRGIGINRRRAGGTTETAGSAFSGLLWSLKTGAALQFDMAALFPGDWNHIVLRSYHEVNYAAYTAADSGDSWYFENDDGENRNGFNYYGNYLLAYQMPIFLNTAGFLAEMNRYLYNTPNGDLWGDELGRWTFSALLNFTITPRLEAALLTQFRTRRNFTAGTKNYDFYQDRRIRDSHQRRLEFYRVAAILTFKLR